ncbi:MAG: hypothetical protein ABSA93_34890 [Streptosporangiaceae bacterium]|jgi:hypothetical protein
MTRDVTDVVQHGPSVVQVAAPAVTRMLLAAGDAYAALWIACPAAISHIRYIPPGWGSSATPWMAHRWRYGAIDGTSMGRPAGLPDPQGQRAG